MSLKLAAFGSDPLSYLSAHHPPQRIRRGTVYRFSQPCAYYTKSRMLVTVDDTAWTTLRVVGNAVKINS